MGRRSDHGRVELLGSDRIPVREVSGLALRTGPAGPSHLIAVGDRQSAIAVATLSDGGDPGEWTVVPVASETGGTGELVQLEAVAVDGDGLVVLLAEEPARVVGADAASGRITGSWSLDVSTLRDLTGPWAADPNSRGEGLVLLRSGHLLVAKEKRPAGLIEFGPPGHAALGLGPGSVPGPHDGWQPPAGDRLLALAWWPVEDPGLDDISDLALAADGRLWLLSDRERSVGRLRGPLVVGAHVDVGPVQRLPDEVVKPEGLAVLPDGTAWVASDRADGGANLVRVRFPDP